MIINRIVKLHEKNTQQFEQLSAKHFRMFLIMNRWIKNKQNNKEISDYLIKNGYDNVAIYGLGYIGETLVDEIKQKVHISYIIDRQADYIYSDYNLVKPDDSLEDVDVIIVTAVDDFEGIKKNLQSKTISKIISFEEMVNNM